MGMDSKSVKALGVFGGSSEVWSTGTVRWITSLFFLVRDTNEWMLHSRSREDKSSCRSIGLH